MSYDLETLRFMYGPEGSALGKQSLRQLVRLDTTSLVEAAAINPIRVMRLIQEQVLQKEAKLENKPDNSN